jgi:hypothetical protein
MPVKAIVTNAEDINRHQRHGKLMMDMDMDVAGMGNCFVRQVERMQLAFMPDNDSDNIAIGLFTNTVAPDAEHDGAGFVYLLSPEEAEITIKGLQRLIEEGHGHNANATVN